jgi:hypothetical protein
MLIALQARQKAFIGIMATVAATAFIWDLDIHSHAVFSGFQIPPIHILHFYLSANHPAVTHTTHHVTEVTRPKIPQLITGIIASLTNSEIFLLKYIFRY